MKTLRDQMKVKIEDLKYLIFLKNNFKNAITVYELFKSLIADHGIDTDNAVSIAQSYGISPEFACTLHYKANEYVNATK